MRCGGARGQYAGRTTGLLLRWLWPHHAPALVIHGYNVLRGFTIWLDCGTQDRSARAGAVHREAASNPNCGRALGLCPQEGYYRRIFTAVAFKRRRWGKIGSFAPPDPGITTPSSLASSQQSFLIRFYGGGAMSHDIFQTLDCERNRGHSSKPSGGATGTNARCAPCSSPTVAQVPPQVLGALILSPSYLPGGLRHKVGSWPCNPCMTLKNNSCNKRK